MERIDNARDHRTTYKITARVSNHDSTLYGRRNIYESIGKLVDPLYVVITINRQRSLTGEHWDERKFIYAPEVTCQENTAHFAMLR